MLVRCQQQWCANHIFLLDWQPCADTRLELVGTELEITVDNGDRAPIIPCN